MSAAVTTKLVIRKLVTCAAAAVVAIGTLAGTASAQEEASRSKVKLQGTGLVTTSRDADGITQDATNSGGFLVGYTYQLNGWAGLEAQYGWSRNTQTYTSNTVGARIRSNVHQVTGAFVANLPVGAGRFRPYTLAGGGALIFDPRDEVSITFAGRQARPAFVYGAGVEFDLTRHIGLLGEYRGYVYSTPDFKVESLNLDRFSHLAQPSFGIYFRF